MEEVRIGIEQEGIILFGFLKIPAEAKTVVAFAHGSGSGRHSPRNQYVARYFNSRGLGTLLLDLLTVDEEAIDEVTRQYRFDIPMLARRLTGACHWLGSHPSTKSLKVGLYGSSTGAAAALITASELGAKAGAVVSRGGRTDLANHVLAKVKAPTLFIVGGYDVDVLQLNEDSLELLQCEKRLEVIPRASHLFEEPGTLDEVARLSADWFTQQRG